MLELKGPLSRILDGPGSLVHRLSSHMPQLSFRGIDVDRVLLSMAEADPEYISYLNVEDLLRRDDATRAEEQAWLS